VEILYRSINDLSEAPAVTAGNPDTSAMKKPQRNLHRSGYLFKQAEGTFSSTWELQFFVLDSRTLYWYTSPSDKVSKGIIKLQGCTISEIGMIDVYSALQRSESH
jgi:hypothetical protein